MKTPHTQTTIPPFEPAQIEPKWQAIWEREKLWEAREKKDQKKFYLLEMFPYPSGRIHMGHARNYSLGDTIGRFYRSRGYSVLHPMGWDAFGLPAENAAIQRNIHPQIWTQQNIAHMKKQIQNLGLNYDWSREIATCDPKYYRWEQYFFIKMYERGLAYRKKSSLNWCPSCQTVLAFEQASGGQCWRCSSAVTLKPLEQWFLKITDYAEELLKDLDLLDHWPERVHLAQKRWIGKSQGTEIVFPLENGKKLTIFTTRPDTLMGVTFLAVAPEHPFISELTSSSQSQEVQTFIQKCAKQSSFQRASEDAPKEGVFLGTHAFHPVTGKKIPLFIANFVVMDYGEGALMAVPAHDTRDHAFAKRHHLPIPQVIRPQESTSIPPIEEAAYTGEGVLIHSGLFEGMRSQEARDKITEYLASKNLGKKTIHYRIRDWGISRQRYWGAPIPMIYCSKCGIVPVPEKDLPVLLPTDVQLTGEKGSPLKDHPDFKKTTCPTCLSPEAKRETDTFDTFWESSWYYLRYLSPHEHTRPFNSEALRYWLPVDLYIGGIEHATRHLIYFRFFHKVLRDLGFLPKELSTFAQKEPVFALFNQGIIYKDGVKMSKSKGNVVDPDQILQKYGADTARLFVLFAAPPEKVLEWSDQGVEGAHRFLTRVWRLVHLVRPLIQNQEWIQHQKDLKHPQAQALRQKAHETTEKVLLSFEKGFHLNTAIAALMELTNAIFQYPKKSLERTQKQVLCEATQRLIRLLHLFCPHITEELWRSVLGHRETLVGKAFPSIDASALEKKSILIVIQVNGKKRGEISVPAQILKKKALEQAQKHPNIQKYLEGKTIQKSIYVPKRLINFVVLS